MKFAADGQEEDDTRHDEAGESVALRCKAGARPYATPRHAVTRRDARHIGYAPSGERSLSLAQWPGRRERKLVTFSPLFFFTIFGVFL